MKKIEVKTDTTSYPIVIGEHVYDHLAEYIPKDTTSVVIVTNTTVHRLYAAKIHDVLSLVGVKVIEVVLSDGEAYKNWDSMQIVFDHLLSNQCDRKTLLLALGGGVIGDMTGFAAATYMRGVRFIQLPTTLLSQVDSSVGGKTGINHPLGKNMIGAFYQPIAVLIDITVLQTLPEREVSAGLAEVIKYGLISDRVFFEWCEKNVRYLKACVPEVMVEAISQSCTIKAKIVSADERENGIRAILNLGHTFGHAIEANLGYGVWLHGEAVGCGMIQAAELSHDIAGFSSEEIQRVRNLVQAIGCPEIAPDFSLEQWQQSMQVDKKSIGGKMRFVIMTKIGSAYVQEVEWPLVAPVVRRTSA